MFDKLIESNSAAAEFKPRRKYFMVSSVVVGVLFLSAVVFSLYAQDLDLGTEEFELSTLIAPPDANVPEPDPPREQRQQNNNTPQAEETTRRNLIASLDQPQEVPTEISTTPNTGMTIPRGPFRVDPGPEGDRIGPTGPVGEGRGTPSGDGDPVEPEIATATEPPPPKLEAKPPRVKTEGVVNGKATYLPNPPYPAPAKMVGAAGIVNVQVTIDETGKVISSKAVSGHPLLRQTAESAAWKARFSPTLLSRVPVKVTGVIVFNFKRG